MIAGGMHGCRGMRGCRGCVWLRGVCMVAGGVWLWGACVVVGNMRDCRGMHGCRGMRGCRGCVWLWGYAWLQGVCVAVGGMHGGGHAWWQGGACMEYDEIRSMSRQYTSYWNAFLLNGMSLCKSSLFVLLQMEGRGINERVI